MEKLAQRRIRVAVVGQIVGYLGEQIFGGHRVLGLSAIPRRVGEPVLTVTASPTKDHGRSVSKRPRPRWPGSYSKLSCVSQQSSPSEAKLRLRELLGDELDSAAGRLVLDTVDENRLGLTKSLWREA